MGKANLFSVNSVFCWLMVLLLTGCTTKETKGASENPGIGEGMDEELVSYFCDRIDGESAFWTKSEPMALEDVDAMRKAVWQKWVAANEKYEEEKLIGFAALGEQSGKWKLPEALEPDAVMPYYWGFKGEKPEEGYPLFLYLHGSGEKDREWSNGLKFGTTFEDAPSVYFIPQIPNEGDYYRWYQKAKQFAWEKMLRLAFVTGEINPNRVYFFGISEGGYGSQRLASFYADYLAGAGPMAGGEPLKNAPVTNCRNIAFSLRTGAEDDGFYRNTLTGYTKEAFDAMADANPGSFVHWIELVPGMGHSIDYDKTTPWLKTKVRNPYPKRVTWENFKMDGVYRKGFYNLYVTERSCDAPCRTHYDMKIEENVINVAVYKVKYNTTETDPNWGIEMAFDRVYVPVAEGKFTVFLNSELVDLSKEVTLRVNGVEKFKGMVDLDVKHLVNSCAAFFDPERLYPAAIEVDLKEKNGTITYQN